MSRNFYATIVPTILAAQASKTDSSQSNQTNSPPTDRMNTTPAYSREQTRLGNGSRYINLQGQQGNVFALMGIASSWARQCLWTKEEEKQMTDDFKSRKGYEHVLETFVKYWGDTATLFRDEDEYETAVEEQGEDESDDESEDKMIVIYSKLMKVLFPDGTTKDLESTECDGDCEDEMYAEHNDVGVFFYKNKSHPPHIQGQYPTYPTSPTLDSSDGFVLKCV